MKRYEIQFRTRRQTNDTPWNSHNKEIQLMGYNHFVVVKSDSLEEIKRSLMTAHQLSCGMVDNRIVEVLADTTDKWTTKEVNSLL